MTDSHSPYPLSIDELFAFVSSDKMGEGLCAFLAPDSQTWMPMVAADAQRLDSLYDVAQDLADQSGCSIKVVRFSRRTQIRTIEPHGG